jgi:hypothetical protein
VEHGVFTDETLSAMGEAFTAALRSLGIGDDEINGRPSPGSLSDSPRRPRTLMRRACTIGLSRHSAVRCMPCNSAI